MKLTKFKRRHERRNAFEPENHNLTVTRQARSIAFSRNLATLSKVPLLGHRLFLRLVKIT